LGEFRSDPNFLIDMLYGDNRDLRIAALAHLSRLMGRDVKFNVDLTGGERVAAIAQLRRQIISPPATQATQN
jgi:hypothetical protein